MSIFSRRKRLLNRTPRAPKMSSRRQFHRALRRHPAWPTVMAEAAARARAHEAVRRELSGITAMGRVSTRARLQRIFFRNRTGLRRFALSVAGSLKGLWPDTAAAAWRRSKLRKNIRRNRALVVTLLAAGGLVALLTGISMAQGNWFPYLSGTSPPPPGRFGAATARDVDLQEAVVFGGFVATTSLGSGSGLAAPPIVVDGETWVSKGVWQHRHPSPAPSPRGFASMAYDRARRNMVLFGGGTTYNGNNVSGETWIWNGQEWSKAEPPDPRPLPRQNAAMVYDAHRKVVLMFGGKGADGAALDDTWTWNGSAWKIMPSQGGPSPRHSAAMAYDECRAEAVMFGGVGLQINNFYPQPSETWIWDGVKWAPGLIDNKTPLLSPPARIGAGMAYSPRSGNVLLYGGLATSNEAGAPTAAIDHDVWRWVPRPPTSTAVPEVPAKTGWERMHSDATTAAESHYGFHLLGDLRQRQQPRPRAYASFLYSGEANPSYYGSTFMLYGGTPSAAAGGAQLAYEDQFEFGDRGYATGPVDEYPLYPQFRPGDTPLTRDCVDPVPVPDDLPGQVAAPAGPKSEVREGMQEIGRLPVLIGTDWPVANRNTHLSNSSTPNPDYKPAPDCPNSTNFFVNSTSGNNETGSNTQLLTDQKRNRVYQFFICDRERGSGYYQAPSQTTPRYQAYPQDPKLLIAAYDGTSLKPLGRVIIVGVRWDLNQGVSGLAHDIERGLFYQRNSYTKFDGSNFTNINELWVLQQDRIEKGLDPLVKKIDLTGAPVFDLSSFFNHPKTGAPKVFFNVAPGGATAGSPPTVTAGPPPTVTPGPPPAQSTPPKLVQLDLETGREDWRVELTGCTASGGFAMRSGNGAYAVCKAGGNYFAVAKIAVRENADGSETPGPVEVFSSSISQSTNSWGDPRTERVLLYESATYAVWVFDGKVGRWVGRSAMGSGGQRSWGFDRETGRLYSHLMDNIEGGYRYGAVYRTQGGVLMLDARLTPAPQAVTFPQFASPPGTHVAFLPSRPGVARRVFIRQAAGTMRKYPTWETINFANQMHYTVLADEVPVPKPTDLSDLDALTIDVAEAPGKTEVGFDAEGSGYGIRLRSVGGIWSALRPIQSIANDTAEGVVLGNGIVPAAPFLPACFFPDRELVAGWVPQARLSDLDTLARSSGLDVDSNSKVDLTGPFSRCNPTIGASNLPPSTRVVFDVLWPLWQMVQFEGNKAVGSGAVVEHGEDAGEGTDLHDTPLGALEHSDTPLGTLDLGEDQDGNPTARVAPTSLAWDKHFKEVECVGDSLATNQADVGNIYGSAHCVQSQGRVVASARGSAPGVGPAASVASANGFSVGEGYSKVDVAKEPGGRGVVVTSTAVATGIQLPGITIGYVKTEAVAWSNGRPGTERAKFTRTICRVQIPLFGGQQPYDANACLNEDAQKSLVDNWNKVWGVNSKMYLPKYDPEYFQGSPKGYIAGVIKPLAEATEDQLFARDSLREVAGLVIDFYKNNPDQGPARQSLQLAAVRAIAGFGVQCNPDHIYSTQSKGCVALTFEDDPTFEETFEEEEVDDTAFNSYEDDSGWTPVEAMEAPALALGKRIGRFIQNLPLIRQLPIREIGEALLAFPVWLLLGLPLLLASRRFALNQAQRGD